MSRDRAIARRGRSTDLDFMRLVVNGDVGVVAARLSASPALATSRAAAGASRQNAATFFFADIAHYLYAGDTALHMAAAAFRPEVAELLIAHGGDCRARNRRGAGGPPPPRAPPPRRTAPLPRGREPPGVRGAARDHRLPDVDRRRPERAGRL